MRIWTTIAASAFAVCAAAPAFAEQPKQDVTKVTTTTETTTTAPEGVRTTTNGNEVTTEYAAPPAEQPVVHKRWREAIVVVDEPEAEPYMLTPIGMSLTAGGGPTGFLETNSRHMTNTGASWDARLAIGTRSIIGGEIGYFGGLNAVSAPGLDSSADLLRNGVEGALRLNIVSGIVNPYILGGVGWTNARIIDAAFNNSSVEQVDNMVHFPVGAGIGFRYRGLMVDTRGVFRPVARDSMLVAEGGRMHTWEGKLSGGWEF